ncbi:type IV pilus biogenesis/stability protein PilW [Thalassotalea ponticola]|uniref:type IV pilus biogenesis/stability protein PilW n=1 Tax=Thalassotalea ponticola TaxID=1523392 RepID=UPI0025B3A8AC|nr:type IV pilus biogenesis/stability protein PilW [Thalassotalea ponticola]MDN3653386.1 type IV pilus biogenesis/stability protein PilW [Thalassotalea ponticola]
MKKRLHSVGTLALTVISLSIVGGLSGCVTQNYADNAPVVDQDFSDEQLAKTRISLALGYLDKGNTTQAKYNLEKARQFAPDLVDVHTAFAHYYESVGEYEQAETSYIDALEINDEDADTLNNFGVFLCRQDRIEEAEKYFNKAIKVPSYIRISETYENIALCYLKRPDFEKTEAALSRSIRHSPNRASSLMQMAQLQYAKGSYDQAANFLSRFELATRRFTAQAIALSYKVQKKLGNDEVADNYAAMLLNMFPESAVAKEYIDNGLAYIGADELAAQYKQYRLRQMGVRVDNKPLLSSASSAKKSINVSRNENSRVRVKKKVTDNDRAKPVQTAQSASDKRTTDVRNTNTSEPVKPTKTETAATSSANATAVNAPIAPDTATEQGGQQNTAVQPAQMKKVVNGDRQNRVHVVKKGENLYRISIRYNITIATLRRWNNLPSNEISVGQVLRLTKPK